MTVGELKKALEEFDDNLIVLHEETDYGMCELGYPTLENIDNERLSSGTYLWAYREYLKKVSINEFVMLNLIDTDDHQRKLH